MNGLQLLLAVVLLGGNAFFVAAEFALVSARRSRIEPLADAGSRRAAVVLDEMRHLSSLLAGAQLGITVCSLGLGAVAEPAVAHLLEGGFDAVRLPAAVLHPVAFVLGLLIVVAAHMVLGEMVPKNVAIARPESSALVLAQPMAAVLRAVGPVVVPLNLLANGVLRLLRVEPKDEVTAAYTAEELATILAESRAEGLLAPREHELLSQALTLEARTAATVALPVGDVVTVPATITPDELELLVVRTGYSRYPVRAGAANAAGDPLIGFVHAKDTLGIGGAGRDRPLPADRIRRLVRMPAATPLVEVLEIQQRAGSHLGEVVDGAGTTVGIIALEDVVEEFVGEVDDASHQLGTCGPPGGEARAGPSGVSRPGSGG